MTTELALHHLGELLKARDAEIDALKARVTELEEELERDWTWTRHVEHKTDPSPGLPVPRLEIRWTIGDREQIATYCLVYKHLCDQIVFVPLGKTRRNGPDVPPRASNGEIEVPFRDGAHIRHDLEAMNLPGFAILGGEAQPLEGWTTYRIRTDRDVRSVPPSVNSTDEGAKP